LVNVKPYANVRKIIVEGKRMEETLRIAGLDNVTTLPNFKPIDFIPVKQPKKSDAPMRFVFLSRIDEDKGCGYINRAAELLNEKGLADKYVIDYYGAVADRYKEKFTDETNRLPNVEYKGFLNLLDKSNYEVLAGYDAMLFPTFFYGEGFAGIFIDAFIAGLPVIATDWSLNSEIVRDGETGIIVQNRSAEKLAEAMEHLIRHPEKAEEMGRKCQEQCKRFDTDHVVTTQFLKELGLL
jgi:glycosyltransferase involved in cell wall biosynthesis